MSFADKARKIIKEMDEDRGCEKSEIRPLPYFDHGTLVIPFASDSRFHWWKGGQDIVATEKEVKGWLH